MQISIAEEAALISEVGIVGLSVRIAAEIELCYINCTKFQMLKGLSYFIVIDVMSGEFGGLPRSNTVTAKNGNYYVKLQLAKR